MKRNRNIVVKSQFNIGGSRGSSVKPFITEYISRPDATQSSMAYIPKPGIQPKEGDGVAFSLGDTYLSRDEVLDVADRVETLFLKGNRAIQEMVISFDPTYLKDIGVVPKEAHIQFAGDYKDQYDDVRLRYAVRQGVQEMIDHEGYLDGKMIGCIQHDTLHLHAHLVIYEAGFKVSNLRKRGREEKGIIKQSSLGVLTHGIDRSLTLTQTPHKVACEKTLKVIDRPQKIKPLDAFDIQSFDWTAFMDTLLMRQEQEEAYQALLESLSWDDKNSSLHQREP